MIAARRRQWPYLEKHVVEAPGLGREDRGHPLFSRLDQVREVHRPRARVSGGPGLARAGIRCVAVGAKGLPIYPGLRDGINSLTAVKTSTRCAMGKLI